MSTIVTRAGKGSALTHTEMDANFNNLNNDKYQSGSNPTFGNSVYIGRYIYHSGDTNTYLDFDSNDNWRVVLAGTQRLDLSSSGLSITGDITASSDIRYKTNIETINNAIEKVQSLRGVTFDWDHEDFTDNKERSTGVIAQDVEKVLPEAVRENKNGLKNVSYGNMVGLLIEAIKEQQAQIDELKKQLS